MTSAAHEPMSLALAVTGGRIVSRRSLELACMFGLAADEDDSPVTIVPPLDLTLPRRGIVLVVGPSGGGKSSLLRLIANAAAARDIAVIDTDVCDPCDESLDQPIIDLVARAGDTAAAAKVLAEAGLGDAFAMLRSPRELSMGQRHRFRLARAFDRAESTRGPAIIIADEFGSTLDRPTAAALAQHLRRRIDRLARRGRECTLIAATAHDDLIQLLAPDLIIRKGVGGDIEISADPSMERSA